MDKIEKLIEQFDNINLESLQEHDLSLLTEEISLKSNEVLKEMLKIIEEREHD